ncbi:unnamed protein product [Ixodes persulcatus]
MSVFRADDKGAVACLLERACHVFRSGCAAIVLSPAQAVLALKGRKRVGQNDSRDKSFMQTKSHMCGSLIQP